VVQLSGQWDPMVGVRSAAPQEEFNPCCNVAELSGLQRCALLYYLSNKQSSVDSCQGSALVLMLP